MDEFFSRDSLERRPHGPRQPLTILRSDSVTHLSFRCWILDEIVPQLQFSIPFLNHCQVADKLPSLLVPFRISVFLSVLILIIIANSELIVQAVNQIKCARIAGHEM